MSDDRGVDRSGAFAAMSMPAPAEFERFSVTCGRFTAALLSSARVSLRLSRTIHQFGRMWERTLVAAYQEATGRRCPGSGRTKRLRKKRRAALSAWVGCEIRAGIVARRSPHEIAPSIRGADH